ncbi:disease resistance protein RPV1 [Trifolium repens]|nr:disease resistance protein RPV1 [Trifolium repens]
MALQSPSSSFPNEYFNYQVFLSFRGTDTRYGFANNLYCALEDKGINTFIDHKGLQRGDEITPTLIKTINESRIYIPIFSINYASSSFCLDELVHIMLGSKEKGRLVLPVFYGVDPSDVRHQKGSYCEALAEHEKKFQNNEKNMERLYQWKIALNQAANIAGYDFKIGSDMKEYEHTFIGDIVQDVSNKINQAPLHVVDCPVGLESRVSKVNSLLNEACNDGVCMIGIHGTGGIGKSTLARAVCNSIANQFECLCFLEDVRENSIKHGLKHLQKQLLNKTIRLEIKIGGANEGIGIIKKRLCQKKVLLILDDVDKLEQLKCLAGGLDWFDPNSRVIVTTRDKNLLTRHGIERIYEAEGLNCGESLELFKWMTFKTKNVDSINDDIFNRAIMYASGLPLAIDVIGSNLSGAPIAEWESILDKYKRIPPEDIQNKLKVSYDGLDEEQKNLFLDIACFFKGFQLEKIHAHYGHCIKHDVGVLVDKSLTKIDQIGVVRLYDLIEYMGKEIKFENMKVLKFDNCEYLTEISNVSCLPNLEEFSFQNCENLITIDTSIGLLSKLKILEAFGCTKLRSFPPLKLPSLTFLTLSNCKSLQNFPEILDKIEMLDDIKICGTSIQEIPVSFQNLIGLLSVTIVTESCEKLISPSCIICNMPNMFDVSIRRSNLSLCLPLVIMWFANMQILDLSYSDFRVLPECLKECTSLYSLILDNCRSLEVICAIPPNLQQLSALYCKSLNSSSKSMLLHESGGTDQYFLFPSAEGEMIPEWFNHQCRETTFPFWFRNNFPFIMIFFSTDSETYYGSDLDESGLVESSPVLSFNLCINDFERNVAVRCIWMPPSHTLFCNLDMQQKIDFHDLRLSEPKLMPKVDEAFEKNEWIRAEIKFKYTDTFHLYFKEENNVDSIRFTNPYRKRKLDELEHTNNSLSQFQPLLKNQRLMDVEGELQYRMNKLRHDTKSCEYEFGGKCPNKIKKMDYLKLFKWARGCGSGALSADESLSDFAMQKLSCSNKFW